MKHYLMIFALMTVAAAVAAELDFSPEIRQNQLKYRGKSTVVILYDVENHEAAFASPEADQFTFLLGSTVRPAIIDEAIRQKTVAWDTVIDCGDKVFVYDRRTIRSDTAWGKLPVSAVLTKNSNIGIYKVGLMIGKTVLDARLSQYGMVIDKDPYHSIIGWGVTTTPLQTVRLFDSLSDETKSKLPKPWLSSAVIDRNPEDVRRFPFAIGFVNYLGRRYLLLIGVVDPKPVYHVAQVVNPLWDIIAAKLEKQKAP